MSYLEKGQIDKTMECALAYLDKLYADIVSHRADLWKYYGFDDDVERSEAKEDGYGRAVDSKMLHYANAANVISGIVDQVYGDNAPRGLICRDENGNHSLEFR